MNERIFELAKQADIIQWDTLPSGARTPDHESVAKAMKFAELIVRECAKSAIDLESIPDWYQDSVTMIPHHCSKNILKHFGVERVG